MWECGLYRAGLQAAQSTLDTAICVVYTNPQEDIFLREGNVDACKGHMRAPDECVSVHPLENSLDIFKDKNHQIQL